MPPPPHLKTFKRPEMFKRGLAWVFMFWGNVLFGMVGMVEGLGPAQNEEVQNSFSGTIHYCVTLKKNNKTKPTIPLKSVYDAPRPDGIRPKRV